MYGVFFTAILTIFLTKPRLGDEIITEENLAFPQRKIRSSGEGGGEEKKEVYCTLGFSFLLVLDMFLGI